MPSTNPSSIAKNPFFKSFSIRFEDSLQFGLGACLASFIFFFSLAFGARLFSPLMGSKKAWQILDLVIASIMFVLAFSMLQEVF